MLWVLSLANVFVYIARYAMVDGGPYYLKEVKGASLAEGGFSTLLIEFSGAAGMLTMGWVSDNSADARARERAGDDSADAGLCRHHHRAGGDAVARHGVVAVIGFLVYVR